LSGEFYPYFFARDLINLPNYHIYLKLMIDGVVSQPFSGETFQPFRFRVLARAPFVVIGAFASGLIFCGDPNPNSAGFE